MKTKFILPIIATTTLLTGCDHQMGKKEGIGAVGGGVVGAVVGSQFGHGAGSVAAGVAGGALGAFVGSKVGEYLDEEDNKSAAESRRRSLRSRHNPNTTTWHNPESGNHGTTSVIKTYMLNGKKCRDFSQSVTANDQTETRLGTACKNSNGEWIDIK